MAKSIPVFKFAFAAYAAAVGAAADLPVAEPERRRFEATWRSRGSDDSALLVKIRVRDSAAAALSESAPPLEEVWLGQVAETASGYSGVVCGTQTPLRNIVTGERVEFGPTHVVDWTISQETPAQSAELPKRSRLTPEAS